MIYSKSILKVLLNLLSILSNGLLFVAKTLVSVVLLVFTIVSLFYVRTDIYNFPGKMSFNGSFYYNPYNLKEQKTLKCNFHAHTNAWKGVTNGMSTDQELVKVYRDHQYNVIGISNYHRISTYRSSVNPLHVNVYEHGYNPLKSHLLVLNSQSVNYFDFPVFQSTHHQQKIINEVSQNNALIALAHPDFGGGRSYADFEKLTNYQFIEVLNHYRNSQKYWDFALSAGRLSWALGNDDIHDPKEEAACKIFTIVLINGKATKKNLLTSMKKGTHYCVKTTYGNSENSLKTCEVDKGGKIHVTFSKKANKIAFIGKNGEVKLQVERSDYAEYEIKSEDPYIRVICTNDCSEIYLNPIVRCQNPDTNPMSLQKKATLNLPLTIIAKLIFIALSLTLLVLNIRLIKRMFRETSRKVISTKTI